MEPKLAPDMDPLAPEGSSKTKNVMCPCAGVQSLSMPCMDSGSCQYENYAINDLSIQGYTEDDS